MVAKALSQVIVLRGHKKPALDDDAKVAFRINEVAFGNTKVRVAASLFADCTLLGSVAFVDYAVLIREGGPIRRQVFSHRTVEGKDHILRVIWEQVPRQVRALIYKMEQGEEIVPLVPEGASDPSKNTRIGVG